MLSIRQPVVFVLSSRPHRADVADELQFRLLVLLDTAEVAVEVCVRCGDGAALQMRACMPPPGGIEGHELLGTSRLSWVFAALQT